MRTKNHSPIPCSSVLRQSLIHSLSPLCFALTSLTVSLSSFSLCTQNLSWTDEWCLTAVNFVNVNLATGNKIPWCSWNLFSPISFAFDFDSFYNFNKIPPLNINSDKILGTSRFMFITFIERLKFSPNSYLLVSIFSNRSTNEKRAPAAATATMIKNAICQQYLQAYCFLQLKCHR